MISFDDALRIRDRSYGTINLPLTDFVEKRSYWWFSVRGIGNMGIIIDKSDGHTQRLGTSAGLRLDDYFYLHDLGFRHQSYSLHILTIHDSTATQLLLEDTLQFRRIPPFDIQFDWTTYRYLRRIIEADCFDFQFTVTACENEACSAIGAIIYDSRNPSLSNQQ